MRALVQVLVELSSALLLTTAMAQEQVQFAGNTTADEKLIHDALQDIALYVHERLKCSSFERVEAKVLPDGEVKRDSTQPEGTGPATYEQWTVTFCGKKQSFLVVFWDAKDGGTMYRIQLPPGAGS